jgi:hypothetical protein
MPDRLGQCRGEPSIGFISPDLQVGRERRV